MSSSSDLEDSEYRFHAPHRILKEVTLKVLIIGDYGVGKTAIVRRYAEGKFSSSYKVTIGADFSIKSLIWDNTTQLNIQLWDIAGNEQFGSMTRIYYKYAVAAVIVFDVSRVATFQSIQKWLGDIREKVVLTDGTDIPVIVMANKSDIAGSSVPNDALDKLCKESNISGWYTTSAKDNHNIEEAMGFLISCAMKNKMKEVTQSNDNFTLIKEPEITEREKSCC